MFVIRSPAQIVLFAISQVKTDRQYGKQELLENLLQVADKMINTSDLEQICNEVVESHNKYETLSNHPWPLPENYAETLKDLYRWLQYVTTEPVRSQQSFDAYLDVLKQLREQV